MRNLADFTVKYSFSQDNSNVLIIFDLREIGVWGVGGKGWLGSVDDLPWSCG